MTWRIPPLGWCAVCMWVYADESDVELAKTMYQGTALCQKHLHMIADRVHTPGMNYAKMDAEHERETND